MISPWELQLENDPVYKYANVPRGARLQLSSVFSMLPVSQKILLYSFVLFRSFILVLFGVVTNGESIAAAANEANGSKITYVYTPLQISFEMKVCRLTFAF